ncbi:hypothetical protein CEXT_600921 [Caerostris extrusa]|uniref:Uncharacterized protein n=1 Tax=Caerostris extrusa TaxID=172846 RepID=A0AAV4XQZ6_CAEEX|nr:hypothetical protein CEXT_600921 [Caerostris extrusa]
MLISQVSPEEQNALPCSSSLLKTKMTFLSAVTFSLQSMHLISGKCQNKFFAARRTQLTTDKHPSGSCHFHPKYSKNEVGSGRENRTFHVHPISTLEEH